MTTDMPNDPNQLDRLIAEYLNATPDGNDFELLAEMTARHPRFAAELLEFAADRDAEAFESPLAPTAAESAGYEAMGREVHARFQAERNAPIDSLKALAERRGIKSPEFARRIGVSASLLVYLEKRRLEFASIPKALIARIAETLGTAASNVASYLEHGPQLLSPPPTSMPQAIMYKASSRPTDTGPRNFAEVVREDQTLSPPEKEALLKLV